MKLEYQLVDWRRSAEDLSHGEDHMSSIEVVYDHYLEVFGIWESYSFGCSVL